MKPRLHIIGHGLAGAVLAERAHQRGFPLCVRHDGGPSSSRVAAGLFTPVTGMNLTLSWRAEAFLPLMEDFYRGTACDCFFPLPTLRIFATAEQAALPRPAPWFREAKPIASGALRAPFGAVELTGGGCVHLTRLLDHLEERRKALGQWNTGAQDADLTIWAEGHQAEQNPLWREAGWRNAHGDVLTLSIPDLPEDRIISFGLFLLPLGGGRFRCGATYHWNTRDPRPRPDGRLELERRVREVLTLPFEVVDHQAGIRPVALARVPILGPHPEQPQQWIFNGFGSKGVLMAPGMADVLLDWIEGREAPPEVQAARRIRRQRERNRT